MTLTLIDHELGVSCRPLEKALLLMRKVLLVCLDNLGDLVFTSALAEHLSRDSHVNLSLWCKEYSKDLGQLLPGVKQVFAADPFWDKSPGRGKGSIRGFFKCLWQLRQQSFEQVFLPSACWRTSLFLRVIGIPCRVGFLGARSRYFLTDTSPAPDRKQPVVQSLLEAFQAYLPTIELPCTRLEVGKIQTQTLSMQLPEGPYVCLHAFAGRRDRCAPLSVLRGIAKRIEASGYAVLWMGSKAELEELRADSNSPERALYADLFSQDLIGTISLIAGARFFIGHDSGPLHIAGALGIPVLGFYLPGEPQRTMPQGAGPSVMLARGNPQQLDMPSIEAALELLFEWLRDPPKRALLQRI